jgi:hypothetical protein
MKVGPHADCPFVGRSASPSFSVAVRAELERVEADAGDPPPDEASVLVVRPWPSAVMFGDPARWPELYT